MLNSSYKEEGEDERVLYKSIVNKRAFCVN